MTRVVGHIDDLELKVRFEQGRGFFGQVNGLPEVGPLKSSDHMERLIDEIATLYLENDRDYDKMLQAQQYGLILGSYGLSR